MIKKFLIEVDKISFYHISMFLFTAFLMLVIIATVIQTESGKGANPSKAYSNLETSYIESTTPDLEPIIKGVKPYLGKAGDEVVVWGNHFGQYPNSGFVRLGHAMVVSVTSWTDTEVKFIIPQNSTSGNITLSNGKYTTTWDKSLTVYSSSTATVIKHDKNNQTLTIHEAPPNSLVRLYYADKYTDNRITSNNYRLENIYDFGWVNVIEEGGLISPFVQAPDELTHVNWQQTTQD